MCAYCADAQPDAERGIVWHDRDYSPGTNGRKGTEGTAKRNQTDRVAGCRGTDLCGRYRVPQNASAWGVEEKTAYVLLGKFENCMGRECTFVEAVIPLNEILFDRDIPVWDDHTWAYIYKQLKPEHDPFVIVGWALDIKGQLPNMTAHLEALHQRNFGGKRQILFLMDSLECEEAVYGSRNGHLYRRDGFYIYYQHRQVPEENDLWKKEEKEFYREMDVEGEEKPKPAVPVSAGEREAPADMEKTSDDNESAGIYRGIYRRRIQQEAGRQEARERPAYAATVLLGAVVCVLGVTAYLNHEKMAEMEQTLAQMKGTRYVTEAQTADTGAEDTERMPSVAVETVMGNVEKQELSAEAGKVQEDVTAQQAETAQGAQGTAEPAENAAENAAAGNAAGSETAEDTATAGGQAAADAAGTSVEAQPQGTASTDGSLAAQTQGMTTAAGNASAENTQVPAAAQTEAQMYLSQGYYDVQKGDSLVGICRKIYQTTAMLDKLCEVNGIEDENAIYAGQRLILPN